LEHAARRACYFAKRSAGINIDSSKAITAITTKSSTNVKAFLLLIIHPFENVRLKKTFPKISFTKKNPAQVSQFS
jgi:hypothetical protein